MATKFWSGAGGTYTTATRLISGATAQWTAAPTSSDIGKMLSFHTTEPASYTATIVSVATNGPNKEVIIAAQAGLPAGNATVDQAVVPEQVLSHSYNDYLSEVAGNVQDDAAKLTATEIDQAIRSAVTKFGTDEPMLVAKRVQGNGTKTYLLSTILPGLWKVGDSSIEMIEYPDGQDPPTVLPSANYDVYDDGTAQDGSNLKLRFFDYTPLVTEYFVIRIHVENHLDAISQNFPDTAYNFRAVCLLASSYCCRRLAAAYAQSSDSTISADVVNYHEKTDKYLRLATYYQGEYNLQLFGSATPGDTLAPALTEIGARSAASDNRPFLFHPNSHPPF